MLSLVDFRTLLAATTPSNTLFRSAARLLSAEAAKNTVGLSFAELTFLPVARRFCVAVSRSLVCCSEYRLDRTELERRTEDIVITPVLLGFPNGTRVEEVMICIQKRIKSESTSLMPVKRAEMYLRFALIDNVAVARREIHDRIYLYS